MLDTAKAYPVRAAPAKRAAGRRGAVLELRRLHRRHHRESGVARHQFDDIDQDSRWLDNGTQLVQFVVRAVGFVLMFVGLWIGLKAINEAWSLYREPQNIERIARAIEQGSNLDRALAATQDRAAGDASPDGTQVREVNEALGFRLSYFVAWVIAILLLMLVGRLAIAAVKTGGELALYDLQIKRFAKELAQQSAGRVGN